MGISACAKLSSELAGKGVLRAGINMSNGLLVTGMTPSGDPQGRRARYGGRDRQPARCSGRLREIRSAVEARGRRRHQCLGYRPDRRRAGAGGEDRVHAGLLRDRSDLPGARRIAVAESCRRRSPRVTHRGPCAEAPTTFGSRETSSTRHCCDRIRRTGRSTSSSPKALTRWPVCGRN